MDVKAELHKAVSAIANRCDGAYTQDGVGFNGHDTKFGKRAAEIPASEWTDAMAFTVHSMLRTYKTQLMGYGIDYDALPVPEQVSGNGRDDARRMEYERKNAPYAQIAGNELRVFNSYPVKDELKSNGFTFSYATKAWCAPICPQSCATVISIPKIMVADDIRDELIAQALLYVPTEKEIPVNIKVRKGEENRLEISCEFSAVPLQIMRGLPGRQWDGDNRVNVVDAHIGILQIAEEFNLTISDEARELIETNRAANEAAIAAKKEIIAESLATDTDMEVAIKDQLYPFQRAGVAYAIKHGNTMIGDEMGLGKTRQALSILETTQAYPALIVCPPNLLLNWEKECNMLLPHRTVKVFNGRKYAAYERLDMHDIIIIGYSVFADYVDFMPYKKALVCDESHYIKNEKANRTKALFAFCGIGEDEEGNSYEGSLTSDGRVIFLTGTPILNRPKELIPQLVCLGQLMPSREAKGEGSISHFLWRYCDPKKAYKGYSFNGSSHLDELNEKLRTTCYVRREKADVLTELPSKVRAPQFMELSDKAKADYERMAQEGAEIAAESSAEALVYLNKLRSAIGTAKTEQAIEWADDFLATGKQLVIFADHKDVQRNIITALSEKGHIVTHILGGQSKDMTEDHKAKFQSGESKVIVLSLSAAREGHTLTAASDVLFVELGWNPGTHNQAEDRCHRIGQKDSVTAWYMVATETIDEWTWELIESKRKVVNMVTTGVLSEYDEISVFSELLERTLAKYGR